MKQLDYYARILALGAIPILMLIAPASSQNIVNQGEVSILCVEQFPGNSYAWEIYNDSTVNFAVVQGTAEAEGEVAFENGNIGSSVNVNWLTEGIYFVKVTAEDSFGCTNNIKIGRFKVVSLNDLIDDTDDDCFFFIPEGFSPNGDGVHDYFQISCIENYPDAILMIYDIQGNLMFKKAHYGNMDYWGTQENAWWSGETTSHHQNNSHKVSPDVYMYILDKGNGHLERGFVMVSY